MKKRSMHIHVFFCIFWLVLFSCDGSSIVTGEEEATAIQQTGATALQQSKQATPEEVSDAFLAMEEKVKNMSRDDLMDLSEEELLELGEPIRLATEGTIKLNEKTLRQLRNPLEELTGRFRTLTREEHKALGREIDNIITPGSVFVHERRSLSAGQIKEILLELNGGMEMASSSTCEQMFTVQGQNVILMTNDNFNLANQYCPAGYQFTITSGTHTGQYVAQSNTGNTWIGAGSSPVMDGQNNVAAAFSAGGLLNNNISGFEIRNYTEFGIFSISSSTKNVFIYNMTFKNIGAGLSGQDKGAIKFENTENIEVIGSYFENVTSSIRFKNSEGPLKVIDNEALNTGRNFFQCDQCEGGNIRINGNSLEHTNKFGDDDLEDFINIFKSEGLSNDYIQVNNNRARINLTGGAASGVSQSGSFIILGDRGGQWQKAEQNIGVNTGNVGIGAAGGVDIEVINNKMYSQPIHELSNVAFYSYRYQGNEPCSDHVFSGNSANWTCYIDRVVDGTLQCGNPILNKATAMNSDQHDDYCGLTDSDINHQTRVAFDGDIDEDIWNDW